MNGNRFFNALRCLTGLPHSDFNKTLDTYNVIGYNFTSLTPGNWTVNAPLLRTGYSLSATVTATSIVSFTYLFAVEVDGAHGGYKPILGSPVVGECCNNFQKAISCIKYLAESEVERVRSSWMNTFIWDPWRQVSMSSTVQQVCTSAMWRDCKGNLKKKPKRKSQKGLQRMITPLSSRLTASKHEKSRNTNINVHKTETLETWQNKVW